MLRRSRAGHPRTLARLKNLAFGGLSKNRLFIAASHTLYAIFLNRRGVQWP
jgi:gluconolactonase